MKGLWKYISPFAPDQSGAAAVLYGLGGIVVICDAGGCAGNICGFDEPRWFSGRKSAVFSAGLRDMDAILGRDDLLVRKVCAAAETVGAAFVALVGTPVPAVIGTDFKALCRMISRKLNVPALSVPTTGIGYYDAGMKAAYEALLPALTQEEPVVEQGRAGVLGAVPLELADPGEQQVLAETLCREGWKKVTFFDCLEDYEQAGRNERNFVVSPAALKGAHYLYERFGTPYEVRYLGRPLPEDARNAVKGRRVLVIHQQITANAIAEEALRAGAAFVQTAGWFMAAPSCTRPGHIRLKEEDEWCQLADNDAFDVILGDIYFKRALPHFTGLYIDMPHFAVSGRY